MTATGSARDAITASVERQAEGILGLSHRIHAHPETAWEEHRSSAWVGEAMAAAGFRTESAYLGLDTSVRATIGSGPLHLALCAEYDALPGLGHACGHNIIAASSVGAAIALGALADDLGLTVTLFGTPAEEGSGGKIVMLERGAFEGVHAAAMAHPGPVDVAEARPYAVAHIDVSYRGRAAHAAAFPEQGLNAADAFTVAQVAVGLLRQHLTPDTRVHGIITRGGEAPNAIPELTQGVWYVRGTTTDDMLAARERVERCFEAGAIATGCELDFHDHSPPYQEFRTDFALLDLYVRNAEGLGRRFHDGSEGLGRMSRASTDMGNVSQLLPCIHPYIGIESAPALNHQRAFADASISPAADRATLDAALGLALTLADAAADPVTRERLISGATP